MAAKIRPSLILHMNLDERHYSDDIVAEIKRSYSYIAPALVSSHEASDEGPKNSMGLMVKLHRTCWDKHDACAEELWQSTMPRWLDNLFYKISNTIVASNKVRADQGRDDLAYEWIEITFGDEAAVAIKTAPDSSFPKESTALIERVRDCFGDAAFGDGEVARVRLPSRASYEAQRAANSLQEATEETPSEDAPLRWDIDYTLWGIEYADGTVKEFDSSEGVLLS